MNLVLPQLVLVRALRMLILGKARVTKDLTWALNLKRVSKVIPSYTGNHFKR